MLIAKKGYSEESLWFLSKDIDCALKAFVKEVVESVKIIRSQ